MLSIIITVFEQAASLEPLLYCLRAQEVDAHFEVLICDDGSSAELFAAIHKRCELSALDLRYIWQSKNGHRAARSKNNGIRCAKGEILVFLDGDILIKPDFLEQHLSARAGPRQIVCNPRRWVIPPGLKSSSELAAAQHSSDSRAFLSELTALAKSDTTHLFELLNRVSIDVDRHGQEKLSLSSTPWMACVGFSFSIDKSAGIYFDENFEGWGPEDREFTLRMVKSHGYTVSFRPGIDVFHLEACSTGRPLFSLLPRSPANIVSFLRNMVYFRALYPNEDLSYLMTALMVYHLDPSEQYWELEPDLNGPGKFTPTDLCSKISAVEGWLRARSLLISDNSLYAAMRLGKKNEAVPSRLQGTARPCR
jgi:glycosyltransferase involved in cell wall biosynthesis